MPRLGHLLLASALLALPLPACSSDSNDPGGGAADAAAGADADPNAPDADPNTPDAAPAADCDFEGGVGYTLLAETLQLESEDGQSCVKLTRRDDSEPDVLYKAVPFTLLTFRMSHGGESVFVDDLVKLDWESTHHNWADVGEALTDTVRYELAFQFVDSFEDEFELSAYAVGGALLWGPVTLTPHAD